MSKVSALGRIKDPYSQDELLSTGVKLLNLIISGNPVGGLVKGRYFYFVGDSSSGKTFFTLTALAEASINPMFDGYRLIYDDVEGGALMNIEQYFGKRLADRIEPPAGTRENPIYSTLVEEFYFNLDDAFNRKEPFIYILDSQDALDSLYARKKFKQLKTAMRTETKAKGDFGDGKAKFHSTRIREVTARLQERDSILIVVNQTRDVIEQKPSFGGPKTQASGGRALRFYASVQLWTSVASKIYKKINETKRQIGIMVKVSVKKNRISGKEWAINVPIFFSHGIDDVGASVDFLTGEGVWQKNKITGSIKATDFDGISGQLDKVVHLIEKDNLEDEVSDIALETYREVEAAARVQRKKRYE